MSDRHDDLTDPPITATLEVRVKEGHEAELEALMSELVEAALTQPGYLGTSNLRPEHPGAPYRFMYKFDRLSNLQRWHASETRSAMLVRMAPLVERVEQGVHPGLQFWFDFPKDAGSAPPKWKTTLLSWAAIFPSVVAISYLMKAVGFHIHPVVDAMVLTAFDVPMVSYALVPFLGKLFRPWLFAKLTQ
jgi:antibiotic biosynthesis monooxygenase (ABM) superfamily enzyme